IYACTVLACDCACGFDAVTLTICAGSPPNTLKAENCMIRRQGRGNASTPNTLQHHVRSMRLLEPDCDTTMILTMMPPLPIDVGFDRGGRAGGQRPLVSVGTWKRTAPARSLPIATPGERQLAE